MLSHTLQEDGELEVAGVCATAEEAIALLPRLRPDLVTMDVELPGMSGMEAVEQIMDAHPVPIVVLSSHVDGNSELAAAALAAGALDAVGKQDFAFTSPGDPAAAAFRARLKLLSTARVIRHPRARLNRRGPRLAAPARAAAVIGLCASTGGPHALAAALAALPASFPIPILVVQHIARGFSEGLARWLDGAIAPSVRIASEMPKAAPGVWIAPEGAHLVYGEGRALRLDRAPAQGPHQPSADVLFKSVAANAGRLGVGVVFTGMGRDGAEGVAAIRRAGGLTVAQDEASCAIFGMPRAAAEKGAETILSPGAIGELLHELRSAERIA